MDDVKSVAYNTGDGDAFAIVLDDAGDGNLDLLVFDPETAAPGYKYDVPRRAPSDYGPEGGGHTWH